MPEAVPTIIYHLQSTWPSMKRGPPPPPPPPLTPPPPLPSPPSLQVPHRATLTATALASAQQDYVEGQGSSSDELGNDDFTSPPIRPSTRIGQTMEIQGCEPDSCDYICTECDWEACTVEVDDGTICNVRLADGTVCSGVNSRRFLRYPPSTKRARR